MSRRRASAPKAEHNTGRALPTERLEHELRTERIAGGTPPELVELSRILGLGVTRVVRYSAEPRWDVEFAEHPGHRFSLHSGRLRSGQYPMTARLDHRTRRKVLALLHKAYERDDRDQRDEEETAG